MHTPLITLQLIYANFGQKNKPFTPNEIKALGIKVFLRYISYQSWYLHFDIDHVDLAQIGLLEDFQHLQIVPRDKDILALFKINAFIKIWPQGLSRRSTRLSNGIPLAHPGKLIGLPPLDDGI